MGRMIVAFSKNNTPVTTKDLGVDGAMCAWMLEALNPNLLQSIEGQPCIVHAGPFANISIGQSSIIADRIGLKLADYIVTESGFAADIGFEKFCNIKCRTSGIVPAAAVVVATIRALKCHGGAPIPVPGKPLPKEYGTPNVGWVEAGCGNLLHHVNIVKGFGVSPVVCINIFHTDTKEEIAAVRKMAEAAGARVAESRHWELGGAGAQELSNVVLDACNDSISFKHTYSLEEPLHRRIEKIAQSIYGARGVVYSSQAREKIDRVEKDPVHSKFPPCMVKTHLSVTEDPNVKGVPSEPWDLHVNDLLVYAGAELVVPVAGKITLMPGTSSDPAYRRIDVDTDTGKVTGLF
jgi:formate--tetrahydrofolate ligase